MTVTYTPANDESRKRIEACLAACEGIPTEQLEDNCIARLAFSLDEILEDVELHKRNVTPKPRGRESVDEANSRDEQDQVFGDAILRATDLLKRIRADLLLERLKRGI